MDINTQQSEFSRLKSAAVLAEYEEIVSCLKEHNFNKTKAAKALGIDRKTLYNKLKSAFELKQNS